MLHPRRRRFRLQPLNLLTNSRVSRHLWPSVCSQSTEGSLPTSARRGPAACWGAERRRCEPPHWWFGRWFGQCSGRWCVRPLPGPRSAAGQHQHRRRSPWRGPGSSAPECPGRGETWARGPARLRLHRCAWWTGWGRRPAERSLCSLEAEEGKHFSAAF